MRNMVTSLLEHGEIKTTVAKAKELRKPFDKMIGLGKRGTLHARRQALSFVKSKSMVAKLFDEYATRYADRNGGYTRIFRIGNRLGDNAPMALIQMVGAKDEETVKESAPEVMKEVKDELVSEDTKKAEEKTEAVVEAPAEEKTEAPAEAQTEEPAATESATPAENAEGDTAEPEKKEASEK